MIRTHESVLLANYEIEQKVESKDDWHARKYLHKGTEVMEKRVILVRCASGDYNINVQYNALGSFHESSSITLSKEQLEFIRELKP
jgi:hypothetical protein